jgi:uridine monophosphate synthetase
MAAALPYGHHMNPFAARLADLLHGVGAVKFGQFTLKDGRQSPFYVDLRVLISDPAVLREAAHAMVERARDLRFQRIAGLPYAGLPIAVAMSLESGVPLIYPRKEAKGYGTQRLIEGAYVAGERVLVVDDVITSGGAKIEAIEPLRAAGLIAEDVLVLVDRSTDRGAALRPHGLALHSVVRVEDLLAPLHANGRITDEQLRAAREFLARS